MQSIHEFEKGVLGRVIIEPEASDCVFEKLTSAAFEDSSHRIIFRAIRDLWETSTPLDAVALCDKLERQGDLKKVGDRMYILELVEAAALSSHLSWYSDKILEGKRCRDLVLVASEVSAKIKNGETSEEVIGGIEAALTKIASSSVDGQFVTLQNLSLDQLAGKPAFPTNFIDLDKKIGGLPQGELWVLAGRPSTGKTALGLNLLLNLAKQNIPGGFLSLEMNVTSLKKRIIAAEAEIPCEHLRTEVGIEKHREQLEETVESLRQLPIYFDASAEQTIASMKAKAHRLVRNHEAKVLFVDYIQLIHGPKSETREREISAISASLKALVKDLDITVVALAQLNRRCEERSDKRPVLADLRESGAIEQDSDGVILVHRPELYGIETFPDGAEASGVCELSIAKNRNGETGNLRLTFRKKLTKFENYQPEEK